MLEKLSTIGIILWFIFILGFGLFQSVIGYAGIEMFYGFGWAIASVILLIIFKFPLPIMYGSFIYATDVWHWHWLLALIFVMPTIIIMVPAFIGAILSSIKR